MAAKKNELDQIFARFGIKRGNRRTKLNTFTEADVSSLTKDNSDNRDNTGWPSGQHIVLTATCSEDILATVLKNWKALTDKDPDQPSTQRLYIPDGEQGYQCYDATGTPVGEIATLENILKAHEIPLSGNLRYDHYLAAIRTKPFLLLAGISGTGKSRLVRQFARGCCPEWADAAKTTRHTFYNEQKPGNFEIIPVRPNWHDSTELMGYESRIAGAEFVIKPFAEFLVKAWRNPDVPFFLCLDEMNLAPVEQYFAEYLSAIESRKKVSGGGRNYIKTDVVIRIGLPEVGWNDAGTGVLHDALNKLFGTVAPTDAWSVYVRDMFSKDGGISIPENLIVMGTVNMDETTCTFSRKVLDRAMSFELNDVSDMYTGANMTNEAEVHFGSLTAADAKCTIVTGKDAYDADPTDGDKILTYLKAINEKLEGTQFKIAYRSRNEIMTYCHERVKGGVVGLAQALDEATNMKILSRIEGDEQRFTHFKLDEFRQVVCLELLRVDNPNVTTADVTTFLNDQQKCAASPSISKLGRMVVELDNGAGFVSYWEC